MTTFSTIQKDQAKKLPPLTFGQKSTIIYIMNGNELLRKLRKLAKEKHEILRQEKHRGKGSHITLYYGDKKTILKDRTKEIGPGLLGSMLTNLGLTKDDIE